MPGVPKFITEPARRIEVIRRTDVLVVGSGPGGPAAALAARVQASKSRWSSASAVSVKDGSDFDRVDMPAVQRELERQGVRIY